MIPILNQLDGITSRYTLEADKTIHLEHQLGLKAHQQALIPSTIVAPTV